MSNLERDKFLTEAMGECWHERKDFSEDGYGTYNCKHCNKRFGGHGGQLEDRLDFSTWAGFGKLWEWSQKQEWWPDFKELNGYPNHIYEDFINPNNFANASYEFLKEEIKENE